MGHEFTGACEAGRQRVACLLLHVSVNQIAAEGAPHAFDNRRRRGLVQRDADGGLIEPQIDLLMGSVGDDPLPLAVHGDRDRIEIGVVQRREAELFQSGRQYGGAPVHGPCDMAQAFGAVIDRVHRRDHGEQHLRGADVRGRLLAADVLFAGLQREAIGRRAARIHRQADDAAGQRALQRILHCHVGGMRSAVAHRYAEALRRANRNIRAEIAG